MENTKLILNNRDSIGELIEAATYAVEEGGAWEVVIQRLRKRSLGHNALFHMWCGEIAKHMTSRSQKHNGGFEVTQDTVKEWLKANFLSTEDELRWDYTQKKLNPVTVPRRTRKLKKEEFQNFMLCVHNWCIDRDITITIPQDSDYHKAREDQGEAA